MQREMLTNRFAIIQGIFYFVTGVWPLIDIHSFLAVTGLKFDIWLVHTVGLMIACTGTTLLMAAFHREVTRSVAFLAASNAFCLAGIDLYYSLTGRIAWVYLLDAGVEILIVIVWIVLFPRRSHAKV